MPQAPDESVIDIRGNLPTTGGGAVVQTDLGILIASFIGAAILIGGIATLGFMMLGAVQWITAGGDKGKVEKAREKITQSIVGLALVVSTFALFGVIQYFFGINIVSMSGAGQLLGIPGASSSFQTDRPSGENKLPLFGGSTGSSTSKSSGGFLQQIIP